MNQNLREAIYAKYIQPTKRQSTPVVGVEIEMPIVHLTRKAVDFHVVHQCTDAFIQKFHFSDILKDEDGYIFSCSCPENKDNLSFDCSYNTMELSFAPELDIHTIDQRFRSYYTFIEEYLRPYDHTLTGMGVNPYFQYNQNIPIQNGRYRMLFDYLASYKACDADLVFHEYPNYGLFSCAAQVQLDVNAEYIANVLNTFNQLEPFKSVLFANSLFPYRKDYLLNRDWFWTNSMHGVNPHNVGMYDVQFYSIDDVIDYIASESMYCVEKAGKYVHFDPIPLKEYFQRSSIEGKYKDDEGEKTLTFLPDWKDMAYLRSFKLDDLTFRGTIEYRSVCTQPMSELFASIAFQVGLHHNWKKLEAYLKNDTVLYHHGCSAQVLRDKMNKKEWPAFVDQKKLSQALIDLIEIAKEGLIQRGHQEEEYLDPLYKRAITLHSPAYDMMDGLEQGKTIEDYIKMYAEL